MRWLEQWARRRAARRYARLMPARLAKGWGRAKSYTPGQVRAALRDLGLDGPHEVIAYAAFLTPEAFVAWAFEGGRAGLSYEEARALFMRARPGKGVSPYAFEQTSGGEATSGGD